MYHLGVVGNPIGHSLSPFIHQQFALQAQISLTYQKILTTSDQFASTLRQFQLQQGWGLNITAPFKEQAYAFCHTLSARAEVAQSVNTLFFTGDAAPFGDNTDGVGFIRDVTQNIGFPLTHKKIVIIGAGGAVRGILPALLLASPDEVLIINRDKSKAHSLIPLCQQHPAVRIIAYKDLENRTADMLIDATSAQTQITLPTSFTLTNGGICYDLKYHATYTFLKQWAQQQKNIKYYNGLGMLVEQAAESFLIWTGFQPTTQQVLQLLQENCTPSGT